MEHQLYQQYKDLDEEISGLYYYLNLLEDYLFLEDEQKFYLKKIAPIRKEDETEKDHLFRIIDFRQEELKSVWEKININLEYLKIFNEDPPNKRCIIFKEREKLDLS